jgi:hypothetical protein
MEIEDPEKAGAFEDDDFIGLVFEGDICLFGMKPAVFGFDVLHGGVEFVEVLVAEEFVIWEVELAARVPETVVVAFAREVEPFWVSEFVAFEVKVAFATESVG